MDLYVYCSWKNFPRNMESVKPLSCTYIQEQLLYLRDGMDIGNKILAYSAGRVFGLGEVTSRYYYRQDDLGFPNRANVKWYITPDILSRNLDISNSLKQKLRRRVTILPLTRKEWQNIKKAIAKFGLILFDKYH